MKEHSDSIKELQLISEDLYRAIIERGWDNLTILEQVVLISTEVHEATNELRGKEPTPAFRSELGDVMSRVFNMLNRPDMKECYSLRDNLTTRLRTEPPRESNPVARCLIRAFSYEMQAPWFDVDPNQGVTIMVPSIINVAFAIDSVDDYNRRGAKVNPLDYYRTLTQLSEYLMAMVIRMCQVFNYDIKEMLLECIDKVRPHRII